MPDNVKDFIALANARTDTVEGIVEAMDKLADSNQRDLVKRLTRELIDQLDYDENGKIKMTEANFARIAKIDKIFEDYRKKEGAKMIALFLASIGTIAAFNTKYFTGILGKTDAKTQVNASMKYVSTWLGIDGKKVTPGGYVDQFANDPGIMNRVKGTMIKGIATGQDRKALTDQVTDYIEGSGNAKGAIRDLNQTLFDTISQVDRAQSDIVAVKAGLNYAIYEGGIIKTTRPFCRKRNGKVFSREEISKFDPPTAKPPDYNPFTDLGGYNCRHHLNWITDALAEILLKRQ